MSSTEDSNTTIFTASETAAMARTAEVRLAIVDNMTESGIPSNVGEIRVLNEVMNSVDKQAQDSATNRLKHESNANRSAILETVAETLKAIAGNKEIAQPSVEAMVPTDLTDITTVAGETDIDPSPLEIEDFSKK